MGIFSRRHKAPKPDITCTYSTSGPYHPSSAITGTIGFACSQPRQIRAITVTFYGHCATHGTRQEVTAGGGPLGETRTIDYDDNVNLFIYSQDLMPAGGAFMAPSDEPLNFDFAFAFPTRTEIERFDPYVDATAGSVAYDIGQHELPPSYGLHTGVEMISSKIATVEYRIEVAFRLDDNPGPTVERFSPLPFLPHPPTRPADHGPPFVEYVRKPEKYSSSRLIGQERSFRVSIRDTLSPRTPSVQVTMKASLAPFVTIGETFELFVCVELDKMSDPTTIAIPTVDWRVKKLRLYENTQFRARRTSYGWANPEIERTHEKHSVLRVMPEQQFVEAQESPPAYPSDTKAGASGDTKPRRQSSSASSDSSNSLKKPSGKPQLSFPASFTANVPADLVPSFRTVNINHHFSLKIEVTVEIAEKKFEHEFCVEDLTVLPGVPLGIE